MPSVFRRNDTSAASTRSQSKTAQSRFPGARGNTKGSGNDAKNQVDDTKSDVPSNHLTEVDREWFNIRIRDLEEKLSRALDERQKFERETVAATDILDKLRTDNEDIIQYLHRKLQSRDDQCAELKERLKGLQMAREKESEDYERELEVSKRMYGNMEQRLTSEIKLLQGKLTSLEEFRIQKDLFENQIKEAHDSLKRKDEELPMHLERMERQTVLRIETMKEEHANAIKEIAKEMEKKAITKLNETSRRALEENTMLLRQVAAVGSKLVTIESQLATSRYQNQGLKALLSRIEGKHEEATKQLAKERSKRKTQMDIEALLQRKIVQCEELEKAESELRTENVSMQKRIIQYEQERSRQQETLAEISHASEKTRDYLSKNKKKCEALSQGIQSAKRIMAAVLAADKEDITAAMSQVVDFINEDFSS
ncbi:cilia- and flagella-associated protein 157-like [Daphnia pulex]|uniref:cilia- and flagella-associated protein 157-like n=1 Tax=Daphnia pulex TaxID=6669 RepID=UPI001EDF48F0|nr:cilia- and flagella-associated protein 157-like [Daphnia pulex]XP_046445747.1 cilia- and flagella-associated protein 157-like [Daphnia pulex]XP_046445748.1 cilia- and flagella-associated protein 157-like [Daphnia pulex]